jgi:hypothetical protein
MAQTGFFEYKVEWNDGNMLEVKTEFSNGRYFGSNQAYGSASKIGEFAAALLDFYNKKLPLEYELGIQNGYSYLSLNVYFAEPRGIVGIRIYSEDYVYESKNPKTRSILQLEILTEIEELQRFAQHLQSISVNRRGVARIN